MKMLFRFFPLFFCVLFLSSCSTNNYDTGYSDGYDAGRESGYSDGFNDGLSETVLPASEDILKESYDRGYSSGIDEGYSSGYEDGYSDGISVTGYTEDEYQRYAQDRVDAIVKELFAGQVSPYTGEPVDSEQDYREYIAEYRKRHFDK